MLTAKSCFFLLGDDLRTTVLVTITLEQQAFQ